MKEPSNQSKDEMYKVFGSMLANFAEANATVEQKIEFLEDPSKTVATFKKRNPSQINSPSQYHREKNVDFNYIAENK